MQVFKCADHIALWTVQENCFENGSDSSIVSRVSVLLTNGRVHVTLDLIFYFFLA